MFLLNPEFDYKKEPRRDILCIDIKSFFASVECVRKNIDPLQAMLVVMSKAENAGGLVLAASPMAKKVLGISNVTRKYDIPDHPQLIIEEPHMNHYIEKNLEINDIYRKYVSDDDLHIYSIDESFLDVTHSHRLYGSTRRIAKMIQRHVYLKTGLYCTVGIGDNPLLAKLALDNEAKNNTDMIAEWHYEDIPEKLWTIENLTDVWGIGNRTEKRLKRMGIRSVKDLAETEDWRLRSSLGVIGLQLKAHAWGIDRSRLSDKYIPLGKSYGNSQVLDKDYVKQVEIERVLIEMADHVAARLRKHGCQTSCVHLSIGFSYFEDSKGFSHQMKISPTCQTKKLVEIVLEIFRKHYEEQAVRNIGISYSKLVYNTDVQLDLFSDPDKNDTVGKIDFVIDNIRERYGYESLVVASSKLEGATAIKRSNLVGGHSG